LGIMAKDIRFFNESDAPDPSRSHIRDFPVWHFAMLNDHARNAAIESMIAKLDLRGKIVFEIGTGSGLISLLFAKYGAEHVFTCETNTTIQDIAMQSIKKYGFEKRITLLRCSSTVVAQDRLLPHPPDIIFSETLDCGIVGEGFAHIRQDIKKLARANTVVFPQKIEQYGMLVSSPELDNLNTVKNVCGFNFQHLNKFSTRTYFPVRPQLYETKALSSEVLLGTYTYLDADHSMSAIITSTSTSEATGIISWFRAYFGCFSCSTAPHEGSHWHCAYHQFPQPLMVKAGHTYAIYMALDGSSVIKELEPTNQIVSATPGGKESSLMDWVD
jgi:type I protein arginine methyltransferase